MRHVVFWNEFNKRFAEVEPIAIHRLQCQLSIHMPTLMSIHMLMRMSIHMSIHMSITYLESPMYHGSDGPFMHRRVEVLVLVLGRSDAETQKLKRPLQLTDLVCLHRVH